MIQPIITTAAMNFLTAPIPGNDSATRTMEVLCVLALAAHLHLRQSTLEVAAREAQWQETIDNERLHRRCSPSDTSYHQGSRNRDREAVVGFNEPTEVASPTTPACGLQATATLVDRLQATREDPNLLASLTKVLHRTVKLQDNVSKSRECLAGINNVLSAANHPAQDN